MGDVLVQAIVNLGEHEARVLNIIKAKFGFRNKNDTINYLIDEYEEEFLEPALRPEYVEKLQRIQKEPAIRVGTVENLRKRYER